MHEGSSTDETWLPIPGWEGWYEVSNRGGVRSVTRRAGGNGGRTVRGRVLRPHLTTRGYMQVALWAKGRSAKRLAHTLVLLAFVGPPAAGHECRHLNGVRNDNRLENLAWGDRRTNMADKYAHGTQPVGEAVLTSKLTEADVREIRRLRADGASLKAIAAKFGIDFAHVSSIARRRVWRHVA
jgi:hypothetical protein